MRTQNLNEEKKHRQIKKSKLKIILKKRWFFNRNLPGRKDESDNANDNNDEDNDNENNNNVTKAPNSFTEFQFLIEYEKLRSEKEYWMF